MRIHPRRRIVVTQSLSPGGRTFLSALPRRRTAPGPSSWLLVTGVITGGSMTYWRGGQVQLLHPEPAEFELTEGVLLGGRQVRLQFTITAAGTFDVFNVEVPPSLRRRSLASTYLLRVHDALAPSFAWQFSPPFTDAGAAWQESMRRELAGRGDLSASRSSPAPRPGRRAGP